MSKSSSEEVRESGLTLRTLAIGIIVGTGICNFIWALVMIAQTMG